MQVCHYVIKALEDLDYLNVQGFKILQGKSGPIFYLSFKSHKFKICPNSMFFFINKLKAIIHNFTFLNSYNAELFWGILTSIQCNIAWTPPIHTEATEAHFFAQESSSTHRFIVWLHRISVSFHKNLRAELDSCGNELKSCAPELKIRGSKLIPVRKSEPL